MDPKNVARIKKVGGILLVGTLLTATASAMMFNPNKDTEDSDHVKASKELIMKAYDEETLSKLMFEPQEIVENPTNVKYSTLGC